MRKQQRRRACLDLFRRYRVIFSRSWKARRAHRTGLFNEREAEFLPAALSLQERPTSSTARFTGRLLIAMVMVALLWSVLGRIDVVVNAKGKIIPSSRTKTIASVEVASVRSLHVSEGQFVHAGDLLVELDSSVSDAEHNKAEGNVVQALLQIERSRALISVMDGSKLPPQLQKNDALKKIPDEQRQAAQRHLDEQYRDFQAKLARIEGEITRYAELTSLVTQRAEDYKALLKEHDVSRHAWQEKEQARIDLNGQWIGARNQKYALIAQARKEAQDALTEGINLMAASGQDQKRASVRSGLMKLIAPVDGTVQQLTTHTVGGVVSAAQPLMLIVPKENLLEVEAFLENKDIGFVHHGQPTEVKIDAFDYTKYGTVTARVTHVSQDAIQDEKNGLIYAVKISLDETGIIVDGKALPLSPGMSVNVEIKTGTRRVIEYVLSPLMQYQREALHER